MKHTLVVIHLGFDYKQLMMSDNIDNSILTIKKSLSRYDDFNILPKTDDNKLLLAFL